MSGLTCNENRCGPGRSTVLALPGRGVDTIFTYIASRQVTQAA
jgi:hypothetical protein